MPTLIAYNTSEYFKNAYDSKILNLQKYFVNFVNHDTLPSALPNKNIFDVYCSGKKYDGAAFKIIKTVAINIDNMGADFNISGTFDFHLSVPPKFYLRVPRRNRFKKMYNVIEFV
jgi:hypothetical protein